MSLEQSVSQHYTHGNLEGALLSALQRAGKNLDTLSYADLALVDEFHIGGRPATRALGDQLDLPEGARVLDVGCGIGGAARCFASERGWKVEGVDLTAEYVEVATKLSQKVGLASAVNYRVANAAKLPFADATFDGAYMLHVGMNIPDKKSVFAEIRRVLKPGGLFAIYDIFRESDGAFLYPVPWSGAPETNFIDRIAAYKELLGASGFRIEKERNRREFALAAFQQQRQRAAQGAAPTQIDMGASAPQKAGNLAKLVADGVVAPAEIVSRAV